MPSLGTAKIDAPVQGGDTGDIAGPSCLDSAIRIADLEAFGEALPSEDTRAFFRLWLERWQEGRPPRRADILPEDLGRLLPRIFLIEVEPTSGRLRYRLVGSEVVNAVGYDPTGRYLDEVRSPFPTDIQARWRYRDRLSVAEARPVFGSWSLRYLGRAWRTMASLRLPLLEDGRTTHLLGNASVD